MNRKEFIKTTALTAAGSILLPSFMSAPGKMKPGLQMWSVRNQLKEDFEGTLEYVAKVGYKHIEGYGLDTNGMFPGDISPTRYARMISDLGMELKATHCSYTPADQAGKMIDAAASTGMDYLIVPAIPGSMRTTVEKWKEVAENMNRIGELCKKSGLKFGYHNHAFEFEKIDGLIPQEILMESTEESLVFFEADLFWVTIGGYDPLTLLEKFPGRIRLFHVKEATEDLKETTIGAGIIDFETLFKAGRRDVLEGYFVEDERTDDPLGNIKADYDFVSAQKYMR
jgi:sugar phosphate isomerase/epimerase